MEVTKWLKPSDSVSRIGELRLPLWVKSGSPAEVTGCPLLGEERKSISGVEASGHAVEKLLSKERPDGATVQ